MPPRRTHAPIAGSEDFTGAINSVSDSDSDVGSNCGDSDQSSTSSLGAVNRDLERMRNALRTNTENVTDAELRKALDEAQLQLVELRAKVRELQDQNSALMAKTKGRRGKKAATLTGPELDLALKEDVIRSLGCKYCLIYCLWVNSSIFPLTQNPGIDLASKERWFSPLTVEEGVKTEIYGFVLKKLHPLMAYDTFSIHFTNGVSCVRSESVLEVKVNASVIFKPLNPEYFVRGFARNEAAECRELVLGNGGKYTKFAPILYPDPKNCSPNSMDFLKTPVLVKILKVCLFGRASLSGLHAPGPQTKARIWELRSTSAGMIAAAAILAIFVLSGDTNFYAVGDKTGITYLEYHNYYCQLLSSESSSEWAKSVFEYFNKQLFPATSSVVPAPRTTEQVGDDLDWEAEFERAMLNPRQIQTERTSGVINSVAPDCHPGPALAAQVIGPSISNAGLYESVPPGSSRPFASPPTIHAMNPVSSPPLGSLATGPAPAVSTHQTVSAITLNMASPIPVAPSHPVPSQPELVNELPPVSKTKKQSSKRKGTTNKESAEAVALDNNREGVKQRSGRNK